MQPVRHVCFHGEFRRITGRGVHAEKTTRNDPERPCGLRAACHVLPPSLAAAPPRIARLGVPIALEKEPKPSSPRTLSLGWRVTKPPWGWLFSTATNSVR